MTRAKFIFLVIIVIIIFPISVQAGRSITLPFTLSMDSYDYSDLIWVEGTSTFTHLTSGCWSGGCAKFTPPTQDVDNAAGLGAFTGLSSSRVNIRFLMKLGTAWASTALAGAEGYYDKHIIFLVTAGSRPMLMLGRYGDGTPHYFTFGPSDGTVSEFQCGGTTPCYWPNGNDTFRLYNGLTTYDYAGQWICVEFEADLSAGTNKVYLWTLDGRMNGLYETKTRSGGGTVSEIQIVGGYYNQYHSSDANAYMIFDELKIDNTYIGPPANWGSTPSSVQGLTIQGGALK